MIFCFVYKQTLDLSVVNNFLKYAKFGIDTHNIYMYIKPKLAEDGKHPDQDGSARILK